MKDFTMIEPGSVTGFASARAPSCLPKGVVSLLNDFRLDDGTLRVRPGSETINDTFLAADEYRGSFETDFNGVPTIFAAKSDGSDTSVYKSEDSGVSWTLITPSSGTYGDTRFPDVIGQPIYFALVNEDGTDILVMQDGIEGPVTYDGTVTARGRTTTPVIVAQQIEVSFLSDDVLSGGTATNSSAGNLAVSQGVATGGGNIGLSIFADQSIVGGADTAVWVPTTPTLVIDSDSKQFIWLVDSINQDATSTPPDTVLDTTQGWRNIKIEFSTVAGTGGPWTTIYDPSKTGVVTSDLDTASGTAKMAAVSGFNGFTGTVRAYRFKWVGRKPPYDLTISIFAMAAGGHAPGGTAYAVAAASTGSYSVAPGIVFDNAVLPEFVGGTTVPVYAGISVPVSSLFGYQYDITATVPGGSGFDYYNQINLYRKDFGAAGYYFPQSKPAAAGATVVFTEGDTELPSLDYTKPLPSATSTILPKGTAMATINDRLFVCSGDRLWYSYAGQPFLFSRTVEFEGANAIPTSGGSFSKPGETFMQVVGIGSVMAGAESLGTPQNGAISVYPLTDRRCYVLSGFDALSLNKTVPIGIGTRSPFSVARTNGAFYYLDSQYQVRKCAGSSTVSLSKYTVDDLLRAIPRLNYVSGAVVDERYYMAYTPSGQTVNNRMMVYNESFGWESQDRPLLPAQGLLAYYDADLSRTRLISFTTSEVVELNEGIEESDGSDITAFVRMPEYGMGFTASAVGWAKFISDVDSDGTATIGIDCTTGTRLGTISYGPISLAARSAGELRVAARTVTSIGANTLTVQPSLSLTAQGGTRLYRFEIDISKGADATTP